MEEQNKKEFKPTDPKVIEEIVGRDPSEKLKRNVPKFEVDLRTDYKSNLKWILGLEKVI